MLTRIARSGPATMTPMKIASAPKPSPAPLPSSRPRMPSAISTAAKTVRLRDTVELSTAAWRSASIGSVFAARRAGIITEKNVISVPAKSALGRPRSASP